MEVTCSHGRNGGISRTSRASGRCNGLFQQPSMRTADCAYAKKWRGLVAHEEVCGTETAARPASCAARAERHHGAGVTGLRAVRRPGGRRNLLVPRKMARWALLPIPLPSDVTSLSNWLGSNTFRFQNLVVSRREVCKMPKPRARKVLNAAGDIPWFSEQ